MCNKFKNILALWMACLLVLSCFKEETEVIVPARQWVTHTVAVVAPLGDAATKARLERTSGWFLENFREAQRHNKLAVDLKIEWYDELSEDMVSLSERLAPREDIDAIIGPFGIDALSSFAPACFFAEKPLIAPTATSEEVVRRYAVPSSSGQQKKHPFLWALTESDVKLVETFISGHATLRKVLDLYGTPLAVLLSPDNTYGLTFNYWAPFFTQNFDMELIYNGLFSDPEDMARQLESCFSDASMSIRVATLFVVENAQQLYAATRAQRKLTLDLAIPGFEYLGIDHFDPMLDAYWETFASFFRPYFIWAGISEEAVQSLGEEGLRMFQGHQGYTPYADPSTGFEPGYEARFGIKPTFAECKLYDALMLAGFAICNLEHQEAPAEGSKNRRMNESIIAVTSPSADENSLSGAAWNPTVMQSYLKAMEQGKLYHFTGASGNISFDPENFTATTHTTYLQWQIINGEIVHRAYFGEEGGHNATHTAAWKYLYSQEQALKDFHKFITGSYDIDYPALTDQYAVLVQGSAGFGDYRHQADVLNMYQLLRKGGFDDDHIILVLDNALSQDGRNPQKGIIRASEDGQDLLGGTDGLPKAVVDYDTAVLSAKDISDILLGNGSDRLKTVLPADAGQNVLFYWSGHGGLNDDGTYEFKWRDTAPGEGFTEELMRQSAADMLNMQRCRKMLIIAEPCFGEGVVRSLEGITGVMAITGAAYNEQSWADNWSNEYGVWMSDRFSQNVVDYITQQPQGTYEDLFLYCAQHTLGSHTKIVNAARFGNLSTSNPGEFVRKN